MYALALQQHGSTGRGRLRPARRWRRAVRALAPGGFARAFRLWRAQYSGLAPSCHETHHGCGGSEDSALDRRDVQASVARRVALARAEGELALQSALDQRARGALLETLNQRFEPQGESSSI